MWPLASGLWLRYAKLQNLIPSFPWIAPPRPPPWRNPRKGRDQILPSGNHVLSLSLSLSLSLLSSSSPKDCCINTAEGENFCDCRERVVISTRCCHRSSVRYPPTPKSQKYMHHNEESVDLTLLIEGSEFASKAAYRHITDKEIYPFN